MPGSREGQIYIILAAVGQHELNCGFQTDVYHRENHQEYCVFHFHPLHRCASSKQTCSNRHRRWFRHCSVSRFSLWSVSEPLSGDWSRYYDTFIAFAIQFFCQFLAIQSCHVSNGCRNGSNEVANCLHVYLERDFLSIEPIVYPKRFSNLIFSQLN